MVYLLWYFKMFVELDNRWFNFKVCEIGINFGGWLLILLKSVIWYKFDLILICYGCMRVIMLFGNVLWVWISKSVGIWVYFWRWKDEFMVVLKLLVYFFKIWFIFCLVCCLSCLNWWSFWLLIWLMKRCLRCLLLLDWLLIN